MAIRDLLVFLKKRASGVEEIVETMGFDDASIDRGIAIPVNRSVGATGGSVDEGLAALASGWTLAHSHPARGTAAAMGERWAAEDTDPDPFADTCIDCNSPLDGVAFQCGDCRGCVQCCACDMLSVGLV